MSAEKCMPVRVAGWGGGPRAGACFFVGLALFFVCYFEEAFLFGGLKVSFFWKSSVLVLMLWFLAFNSYRTWSISLLVGLAVSGKMLIYVFSDFQYWLTDFSEAIKFAILPVSIEFFRTRLDPCRLSGGVAKFLAVWIPLSCLPFLFGLEPLVVKDFQSLDIYGMDGVNQFSGVFNNNQHVASVSLAAIILVQVHLFRVNLLSRGLFLSLVFVSLYFEYSTYARTGWLALLVGLCVYAVCATSFWRSLRYVLPAVLVCFVLFGVAYSSSDLFRMRVTGTNVYQSDVDVNQLGSGRFEFWESALKAPFSEPGGVVVGIGLDKSMDLMEQSVGMRIFAHNGFLNFFQTGGFLGVFLFVSYIFVLINWMRRYRFGVGYPVFFALMSQLVVVQFVQGGSFFWQFILLALSISLTEFGLAKNGRGLRL